MASKQEILELVKGLTDLALDIKKVMADGKVDLTDMGVIAELVAQRDELIAAFTGLGQIKMADIDMQTGVEIVEALVAAGREVAAA